MKVILLENIDKIGKKFEVKEVKDGFARNSLLPKGLVKIADEKAMEWLKVQKEILANKAEENLKVNQGIASSIDGMEVMISIKVGDEGQLFEHITASKIADKLKEMGFAVKKEQIDLPEPIKEIGDFPVKVKFEHNLESEIQVIIGEEK
ncbi:50S ribosomal protein L9 [Patescibacteria group bacterium]|nr:50S ribosomal protein L9 [Patescibacteria group bacterium]